MMASDMKPKVFMIAGEASGDALGASLMQGVDNRLAGGVCFVGVGGEGMMAQGLEPLFPMDDLSVMGVFEVLPRLPLLLKRIKETADAVERLKPDVLVTIDSPDFCFRVIKKLKARGCAVPVVHYVAPSVWAWRPGRAAKVAKFLDHLLCLLPFEPPYFVREGLAATFVGHPVVTGGLDQGDGNAFRARHGIEAGQPVLCVLPGSRVGEVERLLPVFGEAVAKLAAQNPGLCVVTPTLRTLKNRVEQALSGWPVRTIVVEADEKADAFAASDAALAASGTVGLELALAHVPHIIAYRVNAVTAFLAKRLLKTPYVNLVNIILGREVVPELIQENCTAENLARDLTRLLDDGRARQAQLGAFDDALQKLGKGGPPPGERAAEVVIGYLQSGESVPSGRGKDG